MGKTETATQDSIRKQLPDFLKWYFKAESVKFQILAWVPILYQGWELDEWAVVVEMDSGIRVLVNSDHGSLYAEPYPKEFLIDQCDYYQEVINETKTALNLL